MSSAPASSAQPIPSVRQTAPPRRYVVLYDGHCRFCTAGARRLATLVRRGAIDLVSYQEPGTLDRFPGLTYDMCQQRMHLITPNGRVFAGFEAAVQAVATRRSIGRLAYVYYVPGLRTLLDWVYAWIARNRYRLMGRCDDGSCAIHR